MIKEWRRRGFGQSVPRFAPRVVAVRNERLAASEIDHRELIYDDGILSVWVKRPASAIQVGDLVWHGQVRTVVRIREIDNGYGHVLRFELDSGEQLHRYPGDPIHTGHSRFDDRRRGTRGV